MQKVSLDITVFLFFIETLIVSHNPALQKIFGCSSHRFYHLFLSLFFFPVRNRRHDSLLWRWENEWEMTVRSPAGMQRPHDSQWCLTSSCRPALLYCPCVWPRCSRERPRLSLAGPLALPFTLQPGSQLVPHSLISSSPSRLHFTCWSCYYPPLIANTT